jgi:tRNA nucleotidyltransferase (CCA-adding enzyme)
MLLHDIAKPKCKTIDENGCGHFYGHAEESSKMATEILRRMRYDNLTIMRVRDLIFYHDSEIQDNKKSVRKWLNKIREETFRELLKVREADIKAQSQEYYQTRHDKLERIKVILEEVLEDNECFNKKDLAINGTDLIKLGYPEGKEIGEVINKLVEMVLDNPKLNNRDSLMEIVKSI